MIFPKQYIDPAFRRKVWVVIGVLEDGTNIEGSRVLQVLGSAMLDEPIGELGSVLTTGIRADKLLVGNIFRVMMIALTANKKDRRKKERIMLCCGITLCSTVYLLSVLILTTSL